MLAMSTRSQFEQINVNTEDIERLVDGQLELKRQLDENPQIHEIVKYIKNLEFCVLSQFNNCNQ